MQRFIIIRESADSAAWTISLDEFVLYSARCPGEMFDMIEATQMRQQARITELEDRLAKQEQAFQGTGGESTYSPKDLSYAKDLSQSKTIQLGESSGQVGKENGRRSCQPDETHEQLDDRTSGVQEPSCDRAEAEEDQHHARIMVEVSRTCEQMLPRIEELKRGLADMASEDYDMFTGKKDALAEMASLEDRMKSWMTGVTEEVNDLKGRLERLKDQHQDMLWRIWTVNPELDSRTLQNGLERASDNSEPPECPEDKSTNIRPPRANSQAPMHPFCDRP
ncbi:uncharacterized protein DSM5745_00821 [Aspergillus mulundensis]|uniref:Uncharacterized protein n=1 Tax=Aspergillus mulundensis TaxID=1810919 RepID=A0A3D8T4P1_9EURO|nr:hypothetical protein DSM5745_00821 [Aspergillus mulundensis]RDW93499.1 hypothetical protein DSM5745_00821 [Aspergillus mulundensis]